MRERLTLNARDQQRITVLAHWREGAVTVAEASALLGTSERTAWRLRRRFAALGVDGIVHGNRGRASPRRLAAATRERVVELARSRYRGVNDSHLSELLTEDEGIVIGRSSLQRLLRRSGLGPPGGGARRDIGAGASGCPRPGCSCRSTAARTTGSRAADRA
jgi:transposase